MIGISYKSGSYTNLVRLDLSTGEYTTLYEWDLSEWCDDGLCLRPQDQVSAVPCASKLVTRLDILTMAMVPPSTCQGDFGVAADGDTVSVVMSFNKASGALARQLFTITGLASGGDAELSVSETLWTSDNMIDVYMPQNLFYAEG